VHPRRHRAVEEDRRRGRHQAGVRQAGGSGGQRYGVLWHRGGK
jgi:hypothetical protein